MPAKQYPFIDIAVHERVREHFAKGEAAILFSPDMTQVLWSNGQGASLFGHKAIYDFIDSGIERGDVSFRQLEATAAQLKQPGDRRNFLMRISSGFRSSTLNATVEIISVYPGDSAVLFTAPLDAKPMSRTECAERMLSGFDDPDTHMAVLDADGQVIAASEGFRALDMSEKTSRALVGAVSQHKDWLVKRPVATGKGNFPAAIGKLSDNPSLHLLFAVETILGNLDAAPDEKVIAGSDAIAEDMLQTDIPAEAEAMEELPIEPSAQTDTSSVEEAAIEPPAVDVSEASDIPVNNSERSETADDDETDAVVTDAGENDESPSDTGSNFSNYATAFEHAPGTDVSEAGRQDGTEPEAVEGDTPSLAGAESAAIAALAEQDAPLLTVLLPENPSEQAETPDFVFNPNGRAMRFVWKIDADGRFTEISDEFAAAVGPLSADIVGMDFNAVAERYGFDGDGKVRELLQRRDTWSGKMILWPVQGTDRAVPVDLAALPTYSRTRDFDGFRGFGIVRVADAVADDNAVGLKLTGHAAKIPQDVPVEASEELAEMVAPNTPASEEPVEVIIATPAETEDSAPIENGDEPIIEETAPADDTQADDTSADRIERDDVPVEDVFRGERPVLRIVEPGVRTLSDKVIQLEEHRARGRDGLSAGEQAAFREIARKLNESTGKNEADATPDEAATEIVQPTSGNDAELAHPVGSDAAASDDTRTDAGSQNSADAEPAESGPVASDDPADLSEPVLTPGDDTPSVEKTALPSPGDFAPEETDAVFPDAAETAAQDEPADDSITFSEADAAHPAVADGDGAVIEDYFETVEDNVPTEAEALSSGEADDIAAEETSAHSLGPDVVDYLPIALLVHNGDVLHHANPEFLKLTGYASLQELSDDGGIDALFPVAEDDLFDTPAGAMLLIRNDGRLVPVTARLQSVRWQGKSALMMALAPAEKADDTKPAAAVHDPSQDDFFEYEPIAPVIESDTIKTLKIEIEELRSILETATDGVVTVGVDGEIRSMNRSASALFNYDEAETRGKMFAMLFAHESQKAVLDYLGGLSGHGVASVLNDGREVIGRESTGGFIPLFMTMGRLSSSNGFCAVIRDITQWKRTEDELRNAKRSAETANAHKTDFLARVSHEIRTPLNAIIGFSDMMSSERLGPIGHPRYTEYAGDIGRSGRHVLDIVNDLLDISKIEAGEMDLEFTAVGLNEIISEAVSLVQPQANGQRVIVRTSLSSAVPNVVADSRSIKQIALNILANAIRFTPSGGQIVVSTAYEANGSVVLRIRDTGVGMTRSELEQALKPFRQVTSGTTRKRGDGTGLGLPLTKAMVDANRAQFSINSTPNEGTLVEVTFPSQRVLAE